MNTELITVVTTIQAPTESLRTLKDKIDKENSGLIVVGDVKGPNSFDLGEGVCFLAIKDQLNSSFKIAQKLPVNHYSRKNIGYLVAMSRGAGVIYETDDDNAPLESWRPRTLMVDAVSVEKEGWLNAYGWFTEKHIWPRGFPLDEILKPFSFEPFRSRAKEKLSSPIQQGLANNSPDVDAIWRLVMDRTFDFDQRDSIFLAPGAWCPFNSQSTWWWPEAYALMYLPSYCSFRMTDIWRSFVAQRCLWEMGAGVTFHTPEVFQDRNAHDLMRDFNQEFSGYEGNRRMADILGALSLPRSADDLSANLRTCYEALVGGGFFPTEELALLDCWISDIDALM